jgi:hypothetical protein
LALGSKTTLNFWIMLGILSAMHRLARTELAKVSAL